MATEYTAATDHLRNLISGVAVTSKSLAAASAQASAASKQSTTAVDQIARSVELVSSGAENQAGQIADTATAIEELSRTAEQIAQVAASQAKSIALTTAALQKLDNGIGALSSQGATLTTAAREAASEATTGNAAVGETASTIAQLKAVSTTAASAMASLEERNRAAFGQLADFIGHDGEAAAVLTGARGFDRGVEREQVRLVGDVFDRIDDLFDLRRARPNWLIWALQPRPNIFTSRDVAEVSVQRIHRGMRPWSDS
jgi:methyl-accepting chemotaxis protein